MEIKEEKWGYLCHMDTQLVLFVILFQEKKEEEEDDYNYEEDFEVCFLFLFLYMNIFEYFQRISN